MVISLRHDFTVSIQSRTVTRLVVPLAGWVIHKDFLSLRTLAARGRAKPTGLLKSVCDLPDGVVFKCLEYKFGTAGVRVPRIEDIDRAQKESGIMEAIQALAETLQISNGEAIELIMREEANVPDYA